VKRFLLLVSFAFLAGGGTLYALAAPMATGMQYDEINRLLPAPATPPPPGSFAADVAAIESPSPEPKKKHGLIGALVSGNLNDLAGDQVSNALTRMLGPAFAELASLTQGRVERYSFYGSWTRVDDILAKTATIRKCDLHQVIELDLDKKTYRIVDTSPSPATSAAPSPPAAGHRPPPPASPEPPGSGVLDLTRIVRALGTMLIDGVNTSHFASTNSVAMTQATGSCRDGNFSIAHDQYLSGFVEPHALCPVDFNAHATRTYPRQPAQLVARGGCRPTVTEHSSGPPVPAGKLALYSLMTLSSSGSSTKTSTASPAASFSFLTERGNLHALGALDRSLFEIPSEYTKLP
jgi:hypothetical protein